MLREKLSLALHGVQRQSGRGVLCALAILCLGLAARAMVAQDLTVLFGTHVGGPGKGFSISKFDSKTGALGKPEFVTEAAGPAYFILADGGKRLYTCNSTGFVSAYVVAEQGRSLTLLNKVSSEGGDPSYISLDRTGKYVLVANYQGGNILVWALKPDGSIGERTAIVQHTGSGVDPQRQTHAYAHSIIVDPTNRFVLTADLGLDKLFVYKFNAKDGSLTPNAGVGSAPRDLPSQRQVGLPEHRDGQQNRLLPLGQRNWNPDPAAGGLDPFAGVPRHQRGRGDAGERGRPIYLRNQPVRRG
jgi:hypothetical protein